jgi:phage baseplate assembly protein W
MAYEQKISINNPNVAVGIKLPFSQKNGRLFDVSYSDEEQAISNLTNLLMTKPGERIMEPYFGADLQSSLFEQNTDDLIRSIETSIRESVDFWLPYISINELSVEPVVAVGNSTEEHGVRISIKTSVNGTDSKILINLLVTSSTIEQL